MKRRERKVSVVIPVLRSWWLKVKQHPLITIAIVVACMLVIALIVLGYLLNWPGVGVNGGYSKITTTSTTKGITTTIEPPLTKTLRDWLQLLIVPVVLVVGGFWLNQIQKDREERTAGQRAQSEREAADKLAQTEREIAADNQRAAALQAYIDKMSELLLEKKLRESQPNAEIRTIARARTLTLLYQIGFEHRTTNALQFLHESHLIDKDEPIIHLEGASFGKEALTGPNLNGANLSGTFFNDTIMLAVKLNGANLSSAIFIRCHFTLTELQGANLSGATFYEGHLSWTDLSGANLSNAILQETELENVNFNNANLVGATINGTDLSNADLKNVMGITVEELEKQAKSLKGAIMPDGSIHP